MIDCKHSAINRSSFCPRSQPACSLLGTYRERGERARVFPVPAVYLAQLDSFPHVGPHPILQRSAPTLVVLRKCKLPAVNVHGHSAEPIHLTCLPHFLHCPQAELWIVVCCTVYGYTVYPLLRVGTINLREEAWALLDKKVPGSDLQRLVPASPWLLPSMAGATLIVSPGGKRTSLRHAQLHVHYAC